MRPFEFVRLRIFDQLRIQRVSTHGGGRCEDMAFHGFLDVPAVEIALEGQQREIHCVDGKDIAMDAFIIPRRARTVISVIMPLVVRIAFEGVGIVVESPTHAVGAGRPLLPRGEIPLERVAASMHGSSGTISTNTQ